MFYEQCSSVHRATNPSSHLVHLVRHSWLLLVDNQCFDGSLTFSDKKLQTTYSCARLNIRTFEFKNFIRNRILVLELSKKRSFWMYSNWSARKIAFFEGTRCSIVRKSSLFKYIWVFEIFGRAQPYSRQSSSSALVPVIFRALHQNRRQLCSQRINVDLDSGASKFLLEERTFVLQKITRHYILVVLLKFFEYSNSSNAWKFQRFEFKHIRKTRFF